MIIFSEYAWMKLRWFRLNCNDNNVSDYKMQSPSFLEVSLMGISESDDNVGYITDVICVPQEVSGGLTEPTDQGMMDYMEGMLLDRGISPLRCGRFWAHTHPGTSPVPSGTDEETFKKFFAHADFAVMYILADGDDSCRVKHGTKYFGNSIESMPTYVEFNSLDSNGNKYIVNTKTLFSIDKLGTHDGYLQLSKLMAANYEPFHDIWMAELKANVKKKYGHGNQTSTRTVTTTSNSQSTSTTNASQSTSNSRFNKRGRHNRIGFTPVGTGNTTNTKQPTYPIFPVYELIKILVKYDKESINQFSKKDLRKIADNRNINLGDIQDTYNRLRNFEKDFDLADLMQFEDILLTTDGKSNFENLDKAKILEICCQVFIRPCALKELVNSYIHQMYRFDSTTQGQI